MAIANLGQILATTRQIGGNQVETAVAKAYLQLHAADFDRVDLNVGLGPGLDLGPGYPPYVQAAATASTKPRADMILWRGDVPTIVEVKDRAYGAVMGQLLQYWHLMKADNPKLLNVYKTVAARTVQPGLPAILDHVGITIELFPNVTPPVSSSA
jgi:hypothetical protein